MALPGSGTGGTCQVLFQGQKGIGKCKLISSCPSPYVPFHNLDTCGSGYFCCVSPN